MHGVQKQGGNKLICKHCDWNEAQTNQDYCFDCTHYASCEKEIEVTSKFMFCLACFD